MRKYLFLFISLAQTILCNAQTFYCKTLGITEGLSQSGVTAIAHDKESSLWIGTKYGLNEYRGNGIRTIKDDNRGKLNGNEIQFIHSSENGTLWVSTEKGLSLYNPANDTFDLLRNEIAYSALDLDARTLFGTDNGLIEYDYSDGLFRTISEGSSYIIDIYRYSGKFLTVDRGRGISIDGERLSIPALNEKVIMDSVLDGDRLYLAVFREGLFILDLVSHEVSILNTTNSGLTHNVVLSLLLTHGHLWLGTDGGGICIFDIETKRIESFQKHFIHYSGLIPDKSITTLYEDPYGNIWAGSVRSGLFGLKEAKIKSLTASGIGSSRSLSHNVIISLYQEKDGTLWIGTDGGGLNRYNQASGDVSWIPGMANDKVVSICEFDKNRLLSSIYSQGYYLIDKISGKKTPFIVKDNATNAIECFTGNAPTLYKINDYETLILAINVYVFDKRNWSFKLLNHDYDTPVFGLTVIGDDRQGHIYAYSSSGIFVIDLEQQNIKNILKRPGINTATYSSGSIWIGDDFGISKLDITTGDIESFETRLFARVTQLSHDQQGGLWIAADNTLFHYRAGRFELFGENEGFPSNEILCSISSNNSNGVFLGGTKGLVEISGIGGRSEDNEKRISLHELTVKGQRIDISNGELTLPYNYNSLSLTINISGNDPFEKAIYRYEVSGSNTSVIETYEDNIQLHSLKSGKYDIKASYLLSNGEWSSPQKIVSFRVKDPWYRATWFHIIIILLVSGIALILFIVFYRIQVEKIKADLKTKDSGFTLKLDNYIKENLSNSNLDVSMMANALAMSRAALYTKVKNTTGRPVAQYIEDKRMDVARDLLKNSSMSITEISEHVGFASPKYFSTRFKTVNGCSPAAYRKN